jgi:HK97 family phage major capsid protein
MEKLKAKLAAMEAKRATLFTAMTESLAEADITAYEDCLKEIAKIKDVIAAEESLLKNEGAVPNGTDMQEQQALDEGVEFIKKIREAVAVGANYTGLVPKTVAADIIRRREKFGKLRGRCRVISISGDYTLAVDGDDIVAEYVGEAAESPEKTPTLSKVTFGAHTLSVLVKVSNEFINDMAFDALAWLTEKVAKAFAKKEDTEIVKGDGATGHMAGILTAVTAPAITSASATAVTLDEIKTLIGKLGDYKDGAVLIMNSDTKTQISLLKDSNGQYYFPLQSDLTVIQGVPIIELSDIDAMAAGKTAIIAANLNYYQIVDRQGMEISILNELYATTRQKGILAAERLDGNVLIKDAFKTLKMKASA